MDPETSSVLISVSTHPQAEPRERRKQGLLASASLVFTVKTPDVYGKNRSFFLVLLACFFGAALGRSLMTAAGLEVRDFARHWAPVECSPEGLRLDGGMRGRGLEGGWRAGTVRGGAYREGWGLEGAKQEVPCSRPQPKFIFITVWK